MSSASRVMASLRYLTTGSSLRRAILSLLAGGLGTIALQSPAHAQPDTRPDKDTQLIQSAGRAIVDRTFFTASEGNLRGTIYFGRGNLAVQVAPERGTRRLRWGISGKVPGVKGPAVCVIGDYTDISPGRSAVIHKTTRGPVICTAVSTVTRIRSSPGNVLGLGTIIQ
jgi:hypothetical protein